MRLPKCVLKSIYFIDHFLSACSLKRKTFFAGGGGLTFPFLSFPLNPAKGCGALQAPPVGPQQQTHVYTFSFTFWAFDKHFSNIFSFLCLVQIEVFC